MNGRFEGLQSSGRLIVLALLIAAVSVIVYRMGKRDEQPPAGLPLLHSAVFVDDRNEVERLLDAGDDVNSRDGRFGKNVGGHTPLHHACSGPMVELLLARGASLEAMNAQRATPLFTVRSAAAVQALLDAGATASRRLPDGETPLHTLVGRDAAVVDVLCDAGIDIDTQNHYGDRPLHHACQSDRKGGDDSLVAALLARGANPDAVNLSGQTPLMILPSVDTVRDLLKAGASVKISGPGGMTALDLAVSREELEIVEVLLRGGADPNTSSPRHAGGALDLTRDLEMLALLCKRGATPATMGERLMLALEREEEAAALLLVEAGAKLPDLVFRETSGELRIALVDAGFPAKWMPLAGIDDADALRRLIELGGDANALGKPGSPPLDYPLHVAPDLGIARLLLEAGADPMPGGPDKETALAALLGKHWEADPETFDGLLDLLLPVTDVSGYDHIVHCRTMAQVERLMARGAAVDFPETVDRFVERIRAEGDEAYRIAERLMQDRLRSAPEGQAGLPDGIFLSARHGSAVDLLVRFGAKCDDESVREQLLFHPRFPSSRIELLASMGASVERLKSKGEGRESALINALRFAGGSLQDPVGKGLANARRIRALAKSGPDLSLQFGDGRSALHLVASRLLNSRSEEERAIMAEAAAALVEAGADVDARDRDGKTPADWCQDAAFLAVLRDRADGEP